MINIYFFDLKKNEEIEIYKLYSLYILYILFLYYILQLNFFHVILVLLRYTFPRGRF